MWHVTHHSAWNLILAFCFSLSGFPQNDHPPQSSTSAQPDEAALRTTVEKFFAAYGNKDLVGLLALWSEKSPDFASQKKSVQEQFTAEDFNFGNPAISRVRVESEKASLRVTVALTAINLKSQQKREERLARNFAFIKQGGEWNVWRYASAEDDLAGSLVKAGNEAERAGLLAEETDLVTAELGRALSRQANYFANQSDYSQALAAFRLAQGIREQVGDKVGISWTLYDIGNIYRGQGDYAQALERYQQSLAMSETHGDKVIMGAVLLSLGQTHSLQGDFERALEHFQKSLATFEAVGGKGGIARVLGSIGNVYFQQGNYLRALEHYQKTLAMFEDLGDRRGVAIVLANVGNIHFSQGNYAQSLEHYQKFSAMFEALGDRVRIAVGLGNFGHVHSRQGDFAQALAHYQQSLAISEALGNKAGIAKTLDSIGFVYYQQSSYAQALAHYQQSLAMSEALGNKAGIVETLINIGDVHKKQGRDAQALDFAERSTTLARQIGELRLLWQARLAAGTAYQVLNQPTQARQAFEQAIATIETMRAQVAGSGQDVQRFFESKVAPYHAMVDLLVAQNSPAEALNYAERARARALMDVLSSGGVNITKSMTSQGREQERKLNGLLVSLNTQIYRENLRPQPDQARLVDLKAQLEKARLDFEAFETNLYAAHPGLRVQRGEARTLRLEEVGALLPDAETALLEFVVAEEKTHLFVLTRRATVELKVYPLDVKRKELAVRTEQFRQMLATLDNRFPEPSRELYDLLLKPAAEQLQGKTRLVIVPDGPLWELPFQALQISPGRYLIADHAVSCAPSLTILREMMKARRQQTGPSAAPSVLALGNPALGKETMSRVKAVLMDERLEPLPEAERQVRNLERIYGPGRSKVYVGAEAREERFKDEAGDHRILHLATHGILNDRSPMYSHLLLAQTGDGSKEDGILEAWELMRLDLKADLAVLSACETARGRVGQGEGMIGLTWALFVAGVPRTVVSQWKVRSDSTAELMVEFHRRLQTRPAGPGGVAEALRGAALKLAGDRRYRHPFHWAGFIVVGDGY